MRPLVRLESIWSKVERRIRPLAVLVVLAGIALRVALWLVDRNLWLDEVRVAANILDRSWSGLFAPLDFSQSAPLLFLFSVKGCVTAFGISEQVFRLVPLVASVAQLVVFWRLSARLLPPVGALVAVGFCAFSERLLYFSAELKQYGAESLVVTLLVFLALRWFDQPENRRSRWLLVACGSISILFSHTTVFVLAGIVGAALCLPPAQRARLITPAHSLAFGLSWVPLFLANYFWVIAGNYQDELMINFWANTYPGLPLGSHDWTRWVGLLKGAVHYHELPMRTMQVLLLLGAPGFLWLAGKRDVRLLIVALPIAIYWMAGMAHKAPFFGRLLVFLHPAVILAAALSLVESSRLAARLPLGRLVPIGCLLFALNALAKQFTALPAPIEQNTAVDALAEVKRAARSGDVLYVSNYAVSTHRAYAHFARYPAGLTIVEGTRKVAWRTIPFEPARATMDRETFLTGLKQLDVGAGRVWLVLNRVRELRETLPQDLKVIWGDDVALVWQRENTDFYLVERPAHKPALPAR
jgi:hypothetical protein